MSRSFGLPSRGGDEGPPHHGLGADVVSGDKWCHSSLDPSLLQDSFEGQDVGRNLSGSNDHCFPLRFDLAGSSGRSNGRWAAAPEAIGTHQQWWGLSGEPTYRAATSGDGGGGFTPREKGSHSGSEGGDETSKPRGQRRWKADSWKGDKGYWQRREHKGKDGKKEDKGGDRKGDEKGGGPKKDDKKK